MAKQQNACLICKKPLVYFENEKNAECHFCGKQFPTHTLCEEGHYVCDSCHAEKGVKAVMDICRSTKSNDPIAIMNTAMADPFVYMHGPEHHVLVGAALLAAYKNSGGEIELSPALDEMRSRGGSYPGGSCGFWGCCGAAVSAGMFISIITAATPLSEKPWALANQMTSIALHDIAEFGGPRCCKRNSFTAVKAAVSFVKEQFGIEMRLPEKITCRFFPKNGECLGSRCPYHPVSIANND